MTYGLTIGEDGPHGTEQATQERAGGTRQGIPQGEEPKQERGEAQGQSGRDDILGAEPRSSLISVDAVRRVGRRAGRQVHEASDARAGRG
ncbi:hypothetical protein, partial [Streptococcus suis]